MVIPQFKKKKPSLSRHARMLLNADMGLSDKRMLLTQIVHDESPESNKVIDELLSLASEDIAEKIYVKKKQQLDEMLQMLNEGPVRLATYIGRAAGNNGHPVQRAQVRLENGDTAFPLVPDPEMAAALASGDPVLLDAQARTVLDRGPADYLTGEVGVLKQRIGDHRVRVAITDLNSEAYLISDTLKRQLDSGEIEMGAEVVVCTRRRMAFEPLPRQEGVTHYTFVEQGPLQQIDADRDVGHPHPFIGELLDHVRDEMTDPQLGRKYGVRPMQTRLLKGLTGTGKTFSILAFIYGVYRLMSQITGAPIEELPKRVLRMRMSQVLNKYLGESDKRLDRFYDEVTQLANEPFTWNGREWKLPVIARCEEIDSMARSRNGAEDIMGRIQTTALERLDHLSGDLGDSLCIFLFTTNVPELCDQAFIRRAGGQIIDFGRIGRSQFQAILSKKIRGLPMHPGLGGNQEQAELHLVRDVTNWLYSPNGHDPGQVEVTFAGSAATDVKHRRDMLTGSVVDLSVQQACAEAKQIEKHGTQEPGLTTELVLAAFDRQIRGMCEQITEFNAANYLPLPEGSRVASVRRIEQPSVQPFDLERRV